MRLRDFEEVVLQRNDVQAEWHFEAPADRCRSLGEPKGETRMTRSRVLPDTAAFPAWARDPAPAMAR